MKKRIVTLSVVIFAFAVGTNSQEIKSAPTLEVCNAQVNLWVAQTDISKPYGPEIRKVMNTLTSKDIADREGTITDCMLTDIHELKAVPEGPQRAAKAQKLGVRFDEAVTLVNLYSMEQRTRYFNFIAREHLISKFDQEDQAGER
jgi:hypothetical protein